MTDKTNLFVVEELQQELPAMQLVQSSRGAARLAKILAGLFLAGPLLMLMVPWQQNVRGMGRVAAFAPLERQQAIEAPVDGRIVQWWIAEGSAVKQGDRLLEISDLDPDLMSNMAREQEALQAKYEAYVAKIASYENQIASLETNRDLAVTAAEFRMETARERVASEREDLEAAQAALHAARLHLRRHQNLLEDGLVSQRDYEVATRDVEIADSNVDSSAARLRAAEQTVEALKAEIQKVRTDVQAKIDSTIALLSEARSQSEDARASIAKIQVQISRQRSQLVVAPRDGTVLRLIANQGGEIVKAGDPLLVLVPETVQRAVELWVDGNDAPLVSPGRHVRLQFEGWPAVQFAGWPSVAVGTFGGIIKLVDPTDDGQGRFRIMVLPDPEAAPWPADRFLRQGVRAKGWILLDRVSMGYELWRQLNGFPPVVAREEPADNLARNRIK